jgi:cytochrome b561
MSPDRPATMASSSASASVRLEQRQMLNNHDGFGLISRILHWSMAALVVAAVTLGLVAASYERGDLVRDQVLFVHKPLGLIILALAIVRLGWILRSPAPPFPGILARWERRVAWLVHKALYVLLFAMPLSGILLSQAAGREVSLFGLFSLPQLVPIDPSVAPEKRLLVFVGFMLHKQVLPWVLYGLVALHVLGVVKHHILDGHRYFIRRMWGGVPR